MRKLLVTLLVLAFAACLPTTTNAQPRKRFARQRAQPTRYYRPARRPLLMQSGSRQNGSIFSNLMEIERRKNAWLRRTFLGR